MSTQETDPTIERCREALLDLQSKRKLAQFARDAGIPKTTLSEFARGATRQPGYGLLVSIQAALETFEAA